MAAEQYILKASYAHCTLADRAKFNASNCIMPISIGQNIHEAKNAGTL